MCRWTSLSDEKKRGGALYFSQQGRILQKEQSAFANMEHKSKKGNNLHFSPGRSSHVLRKRAPGRSGSYKKILWPVFNRASSAVPLDLSHMVSNEGATPATAAGSTTSSSTTPDGGAMLEEAGVLTASVSRSESPADLAERGS